jgi:HK97 family phage major capsid protein
MSKKDVKRLRAERDAKVTELEGIVKAAAGDPTAAEPVQAREFTPEESFKRGELTTQITGLEDRIAQAKTLAKEERAQEALKLARETYGYGPQPYEFNSVGGSLKVTSEHRVYERGNGQSYLYDIACMGFGAGLGGRYFAAHDRLQRHAQENHVEAVAIDSKVTRSAEESYFLSQMIEAKNTREDNRGHAWSYRALSISSGAGGEFVPPLFATADWIAFMRAARALADCQNNQPLPDGTMTINIPKVTAGTAVGPQAGGENTNVLEVDLQTEFISLPVVVKAGSQLISLQLLERSPIAFDQMVFTDLGKAYAQAVDVAVANGNGIAPPTPMGPGGPDVVGILNTANINLITWTQASPKITGLFGQLGQAKADIANTLFLPATHCFMTPTYWEWLASQFDTNGRPLVVPSYNGPFNVAILGTDQQVVEGAIGRRISGLNTFEDANLPQTLNGNQSVIIVGKFDENYLFESPVITRALPQTYGNQLSVLLQIYCYISYTAGRYPNANSVITGSGLVTPTFAS